MVKDGISICGVREKFMNRSHNGTSSWKEWEEFGIRSPNHKGLFNHLPGYVEHFNIARASNAINLTLFCEMGPQALPH
jgi:hypothetical protein